MQKDKKFVNKIFKQLISNKKKLHIVSDKLGTPTYTYDFAKEFNVNFRKKFKRYF